MANRDFFLYFYYTSTCARCDPGWHTPHPFLFEPPSLFAIYSAFFVRFLFLLPHLTIVAPPLRFGESHVACMYGFASDGLDSTHNCVPLVIRSIDA